MKKTALLFFLSTFFSCVNAQKTSAPEAPKETYIEPISNSEKLVSTLSIPISIPLKEIENQINNSIKGVIYEDDSYDNNNEDLLKMKVWKNGQIEFTAVTNDIFDYKVPLKIWANKQISVFGIKQDKSTTFEMNLKFSSRFIISNDWNVQTLTSPKGFEYITEPRVTFNNSISIPITPIISKIIENNHSFISRKIDESVKNEISLKPYIVDAWNVIKQPYLVSEEYNTWMQITPLSILITPLKTEGTILKSKIGFTAYTETMTGNQPDTPKPVTTVPPLKYVTSIPDEFKVSLRSTIPFSEATAIGKKLFIGEKYSFKNNKYVIQVSDIEIYGSNESLVIRLETKGDLKGNIYIKGTPFYNESSKSIELSNTKLDIKTKNVLVKAASWLLEGTLERKIENEFKIPTEELIGYAKENVEASLNTQWMKGVKTTCKINAITPNKVSLNEKGISTLITASGTVSLDVNGL